MYSCTEVHGLYLGGCDGMIRLDIVLVLLLRGMIYPASILCAEYNVSMETSTSVKWGKPHSDEIPYCTDDTTRVTNLDNDTN